MYGAAHQRQPRRNRGGSCSGSGSGTDYSGSGRSGRRAGGRERKVRLSEVPPRPRSGMGKRRGRRAEGDTRDTGWPKTNAARRGGGRVREEGGETEVGGRTGEGER